MLQIDVVGGGDGGGGKGVGGNNYEDGGSGVDNSESNKNRSNKR